MEGRPFEPSMTVTVVTLALLGVGENVVGFRRFSEFLLGLFVTRIPVRMILEAPSAGTLF